MSSPNILYIFTDQLRSDAIGAINDEVITPNLDRLADKAMVFRRCISNSPLCVPARASLMTGQLPRQNGVWSNRKGADVRGPSHVRRIRDNGYDTAVIGKTHLWRTGPGPKPGMHSGTMDSVLEDWGFDYRIEVNDPIGTGSMGCAYTDHLKKIGWLEPHREYIQQWIREMRSGNVRPWLQNPSPVPDENDIDSFIGWSALHWLKNRDCDRSFYLQVQFTGPHDPYDGPYRYRELYDSKQISPGLRELPDEPMHPWLAARLKSTRNIANATDAEIRQWRVNYYANVTLIDDWIGRILHVLRNRDWERNTWIVFTSDHGEMLGDHGLWGKTLFQNPSVNVPLILKSPEGRQGICNNLVEQVDVAATLLDIAGLKFEQTRGKSLVKMMTEEEGKERERDHAISELFGETTVVTDDYKLTVQSDTKIPTQLFDLQQDPFERQNVVNQSRYRSEIGRLQETYIEPLTTQMDNSAFDEYREYVRASGRRN